MKPDWSTAPDFARYLAMDDDGVWNWFENKPFRAPGHWFIDSGKWLRCKMDNWRDTLEERPEAEGSKE